MSITIPSREDAFSTTGKFTKEERCSTITLSLLSAQFRNSAKARRSYASLSTTLWVVLRMVISRCWRNHEGSTTLMVRQKKKGKRPRLSAAMSPATNPAEGSGPKNNATGMANRPEAASIIKGSNRERFAYSTRGILGRLRVKLSNANSDAVNTSAILAPSTCQSTPNSPRATSVSLKTVRGVHWNWPK